jgi:hypothetical protein
MLQNLTLQEPFYQLEPAEVHSYGVIYPLPQDRFVRILRSCFSPDAKIDRAISLRQSVSINLGLQVMNEVNRLNKFSAEENFDDLFYLPKGQSFISSSEHDEFEIQAFWMTLRYSYLESLYPQQRKGYVQMSEQLWAHPYLLLTELFKMSSIKDRLQLISRMSYREFEAFIKEADKLGLPLKADSRTIKAAIVAYKNGKESAKRSLLMSQV